MVAIARLRAGPPRGHLSDQYRRRNAARVVIEHHLSRLDGPDACFQSHPDPRDGAFGDEIEDRTLPYLTLKPVSRLRIVIEKFLGILVIALPTILLGIFGGWLIDRLGTDESESCPQRSRDLDRPAPLPDAGVRRRRHRGYCGRSSPRQPGRSAGAGRRDSVLVHVGEAARAIPAGRQGVLRSAITSPRSSSASSMLLTRRLTGATPSLRRWSRSASSWSSRSRWHLAPQPDEPRIVGPQPRRHRPHPPWERDWPMAGPSVRARA